MTDYLFLLATGVASWVAVDPFEWRFERIATTKHVPAFLMLTAWILSSMSDRMRLARSPSRGIRRSLAPMIALAAFITAGSVYARVGHDMRTAF